MPKYIEIGKQQEIQQSIPRVFYKCPLAVDATVNTEVKSGVLMVTKMNTSGYAEIVLPDTVYSVSQLELDADGDVTVDVIRRLLKSTVFYDIPTAPIQAYGGYNNANIRYWDNRLWITTGRYFRTYNLVTKVWEDPGIPITPSNIYAFDRDPTSGKIFATRGYSMYVYDEATGQWTTSSSYPETMKSDRIGVWNGKAYCVGGSDPYPVYEYDPETDTWTKIWEDPPSTYVPYAFMAAKGNLYIICQKDINNLYVYRYDPGEGTFTLTGGTPYAGASYSTDGTYVYCVSRSSYYSAYRFDPDDPNNTQENLGEMVEATYPTSATDGNNLYVIKKNYNDQIVGKAVVDQVETFVQGLTDGALFDARRTSSAHQLVLRINLNSPSARAYAIGVRGEAAV